MSHVRTQIRAAVAEALAAIDATVYVSRTLPIEQPDLPAILVYTNDEDIAQLTTEHYKRSLALVVEAVCSGSTIDDDVDAMIVSIETALNDSTLTGLCKPLAPTSIAITVNTDVNKPLARARMNFRAVYFTAHGNPAAAV